METFNFDKIKKVMIFGAHPDDEIIGPGGAIHRLSKEGKEIYVVTFTSGGTAANSPEEMELMIEKRKEEMEKADQLLGVRQRITLGYSSQELYSALYGGKKLHHQLIKLFRQYTPDISFTHFKDNHPDHNAVYTVIKEAVFQSSESVMGYLGKPWTTASLFYYGVEQELPEANIIVEITQEDLEIKIKALETQVSQERNNYLERIKHMIEARAKLWGARFFGVEKLAEPFYISYKNPILIGK